MWERMERNWGSRSTLRRKRAHAPKLGRGQYWRPWGPQNLGPWKEDAGKKGSSLLGSPAITHSDLCHRLALRLSGRLAPSRSFFVVVERRSALISMIPLQFRQPRASSIAFKRHALHIKRRLNDTPTMMPHLLSMFMLDTGPSATACRCAWSLDHALYVPQRALVYIAMHIDVATNLPEAGETSRGQSPVHM